MLERDWNCPCWVHVLVPGSTGPVRWIESVMCSVLGRHDVMNILQFGSSLCPIYYIYIYFLRIDIGRTSWRWRELRGTFAFCSLFWRSPSFVVLSLDWRLFLFESSLLSFVLSGSEFAFFSSRKFGWTFSSLSILWSLSEGQMQKIAVMETACVLQAPSQYAPTRWAFTVLPVRWKKAVDELLAGIPPCPLRVAVRTESRPRAKLFGAQGELMRNFIDGVTWGKEKAKHEWIS